MKVFYEENVCWWHEMMKWCNQHPSCCRRLSMIMLRVAGLAIGRHYHRRYLVLFICAERPSRALKNSRYLRVRRVWFPMISCDSWENVDPSILFRAKWTSRTHRTFANAQTGYFFISREFYTLSRDTGPLLQSSFEHSSSCKFSGENIFERKNFHRILDLTNRIPKWSSQ